MSRHMTLPVSRRRALAAAALAPLLVAAARAQPAGDLLFGALFPFSGPLSLIGDESFRGLELAAEARNQAGGLLGRQVVLARGDAADAAAASAAAKRLIGETRVQAIFGTGTAPASLAASQAAELAGTPYFELDATADPITERGFRRLFRSCPRLDALLGQAFAAITGVLAPAWHVRPDTLRTVLLHQEGLHGGSVSATGTAAATAAGLTLADMLGYPAEAMDFAPLVRRLRDGRADVVLHAGGQSDIVQFYRAMADARWMPRMVIGIGGGYALADIARAAGPDFTGTLCAGFPPYAIAPAAAPGAEAVREAYLRKYGMPPRSGHSLAAYAGAQIFMDAIARTGGNGSVEADALRTALLATEIPEGGTANGWGAAFDDHGQNSRSRPVLAQWQKGALVTVAPAAAALARPVPQLGA
jgi:branched-chain amino acid transport system substrate-binding protein